MGRINKPVSISILHEDGTVHVIRQLTHVSVQKDYVAGNQVTATIHMTAREFLVLKEDEHSK